MEKGSLCSKGTFWKGGKCASPESGKEVREGQEQLAKSGASGSFAPGTNCAQQSVSPCFLAEVLGWWELEVPLDASRFHMWFLWSSRQVQSGFLVLPVVVSC